MKKVALTIENGNEAGRVLWVRLDQVIEVGSSDSVDFPVTGDSEMAPLHFEIRHHRYGCFVEAFGERSVFRINDRDALRKRLHDGDILVAGQTTFVTRIEGEPENGAAEARKLPSQIDTVSAEDLAVEVTNVSDENDDPPPADSPIEEAPAEPATDQWSYEAQELAASTWLYQPEQVSIPVADIINSVDESLEMYGVANRRTNVDLDSSDDYHDIDANRVLIGPCAGDALVELLMQDSSAMAIFSDSTVDEILQAIRLEPFSFAQPSVFSTQVSMGTNSMVEKLMRNKVAVLVTDPQIGWQLFSTWDLATDWSKIGFPNSPRVLD